MAAQDPNALALVYNDPSNMQLTGTSASTSNALTIPSTHPSLRASSANPNTGLKNVPAFLNKLYSMVNDPATDHLIRWTDDGTSFIVPSSEKFGKELLPRFFKHSNFGSFVRQLNMYGFHKVPHLQQGVLKLDDEDEKEKAEILEFQNDNFQRDQPDLLYLIQRKKGASTVNASGRTGSEDLDGGKAGTPTAGASGSGSGGSTSNSNNSGGMNAAKLQAELAHILNEVTAIKRHQSILSTDLRDLQNTNRTLWQDNMEQRVKHDKNAEMIDKILKFLAGVFGGRALSEGASFMSGHNIAAADSSSGLGLGSYGQGGGGRSNPPSGNNNDSSNRKASTSNTAPNGGYDLVPPHKRQQRLLLQGSPDKPSTLFDSDSPNDVLMSQFEELGSDDDISVPGKKSSNVNGGTGIDKSSSGAGSPDTGSADSSRFNEIRSTSGGSEGLHSSVLPSNIAGGTSTSSINPVSTATPPTENLDVSSLINNNDNIDWASINAILNSGTSTGNNNNNNNNNNLGPGSFGNTDLSNFDFSSSGVFGMPSSSNAAYTNVNSSMNMDMNTDGSGAGSNFTNGTNAASQYQPTNPFASAPSAPPAVASTANPSPFSFALPSSNAPYSFPNANTNLNANSKTNTSSALSLPTTNNNAATIASNSQAITKYGNALSHVSDENAKIKERMDNLSSAIDRLVSQLPDGFNFTQQPPQPSQQQAYSHPATSSSNAVPPMNMANQQTTVGNDYDDEFDFSQYLNNPTLDLDDADSFPSSSIQQQQQQDPLYGFLDPSLADPNHNSRASSLNATGVPLSFSDPLASIPATHTLASAAPQNVPASSLDLEKSIKVEPTPSPGPTADITVPDLSSTTSNQNRPGGKASKMPAKAPARTNKRRSSTSVALPTGEQANSADSHRRSTRQKTGKA